MHMRTVNIFLITLLLSSLGLGDTTPHTKLTTVLQNHVHEGKVDYEGIRKHRRDELTDFVRSLATARPDKMEHQQQIAFWLDAYNGLVIHQVVEKDAAPDSKRSRARFFRGRRYKVAGQSLTLDDIEHKALRPLAKDPRVHFVLVCAAQSCPQLQASSFLGTENLDDTLEQATRNYINDSKNVEIRPETQTLVLNKIFDWYSDDFGDVVKFVAKYRNSEERKSLETGDWKVEYRDYVWDLNESESNS